MSKPIAKNSLIFINAIISFKVQTADQMALVLKYIAFDWMCMQNMTCTAFREVFGPVIILCYAISSFIACCYFTFFTHYCAFWCNISLLTYLISGHHSVAVSELLYDAKYYETSSYVNLNSSVTLWTFSFLSTPYSCLFLPFCCQCDPSPKYNQVTSAYNCYQPQQPTHSKEVFTSIQSMCWMLPSSGDWQLFYSVHFTVNHSQLLLCNVFTLWGKKIAPLFVLQ